MTVGERTAEKMLPLGILISASAAKVIQLIDEIFETKSSLRKAATAQLDICFKCDQKSRRTTMKYLRHSIPLQMKKEEDLDSKSM